VTINVNQVQALEGDEVSPKGGEFVLNAKPSKWAFDFVSRPQVGEFDFLLGQIHTLLGVG